MTEDTIESLQAKVHAYVVSNFHVPDPSQLTADASLLHLGIVDSMGFHEIFKWVHEEFGVEVASGEMVPENFETVANIVRYLHAKRG